MGTTRNYYTKWSKSDKERQISYDITSMWNLKHDTWTFLRNRNRLTDIENDLQSPQRWRRWGWMDWEFGISRHKLLYRGRINNKRLLYQWSGLPFPSPMHESKKWKWSHSVLSDPQRPHGLQPSRLLRPWDFPGKSMEWDAIAFSSIAQGTIFNILP